jgi:hypothetical protein
MPRAITIIGVAGRPLRAHARAGMLTRQAAFVRSEGDGASARAVEQIKIRSGGLRRGKSTPPERTWGGLRGWTISAVQRGSRRSVPKRLKAFHLLPR